MYMVYFNIYELLPKLMPIFIAGVDPKTYRL